MQQVGFHLHFAPAFRPHRLPSIRTIKLTFSPHMAPCSILLNPLGPFPLSRFPPFFQVAGRGGAEAVHFAIPQFQTHSKTAIKKKKKSNMGSSILSIVLLPKLISNKR